VNAELRTLKGPRHNTVVGSSMGGLISFDLCRRYPQVFGAGGCVAMHVTFSPAQIAGDFSGQGPTYLETELERGLRFARGPRLWIDQGTLGIDAHYGPVQAKLATWLRGQGWREGSDFVVRRYEGSEHNEAAWRARMDDVLAFLYRGR
jgi:enterochelin esterase-like enzyme